jgi:hypothetical protein
VSWGSFDVWKIAGEFTYRARVGRLALSVSDDTLSYEGDDEGAVSGELGQVVHGAGRDDTAAGAPGEELPAIGGGNQALIAAARAHDEHEGPGHHA